MVVSPASQATATAAKMQGILNSPFVDNLKALHPTLFANVAVTASDVSMMGTKTDSSNRHPVFLVVIFVIFVLCVIAIIVAAVKLVKFVSASSLLIISPLPGLAAPPASAPPRDTSW
jgi:hypothetical protein